MLDSYNQHRVIRLCVSQEASKAIMRLAKSKGLTVNTLLETWISDCLADDLAPFLVAEAHEAAQRMISAGVRAEVSKTWRDPDAVEVVVDTGASVSSPPRKASARVNRSVFASRVEAGVAVDA
jgi:hypothetical protein